MLPLLDGLWRLLGSSTFLGAILSALLLPAAARASSAEAPPAWTPAVVAAALAWKEGKRREAEATVESTRAHAAAFGPNESTGTATDPP